MSRGLQEIKANNKSIRKCIMHCNLGVHIFYNFMALWTLIPLFSLQANSNMFFKTHITCYFHLSQHLGFCYVLASVDLFLYSLGSQLLLPLNFHPILEYLNYYRSMSLLFKFVLMNPTLKYELESKGDAQFSSVLPAA